MRRGKLSGREKGWLLFAAALVALGAVCFAVSGTRFLGYLCVEGAACCVVWIFLCRRAKESRRWLWCKRLFAAGFAAMLLLLAVMEGFILSYGARDHMGEPADAIIILGAGINDSEPSPALWTRLRKAEAYMEQHPGIPVVLSGGLGLGEKITEAECMYNALRRGTTRGTAACYRSQKPLPPRRISNIPETCCGRRALTPTPPPLRW